MAKITTNQTNTINQWLTNHNTLAKNVGDLALLMTTEDSDLVGAINSLYTTAILDSDISWLQTQITNNDSDIYSLQTQTTTSSLQAQITSNDNDISTLQTRVTSNDNDISSLQTQVTSNDNDISSLQTQVTSNDNDISSISTSLSGYLRSNVTDNKTSGNLIFNDNIKGAFGTGSDLQIYHNGSNSYITDTGTGSLIIGGSIKFPNGINLTGGASDWSFTVVSNNLIIKYGSTSLAKLDTSGNLTVTGDINSNGTI